MAARFRDEDQSALAWLLGIARNLLGRSWQRGQIERRLRQVLAWRGLDPRVFGARLGISAKTTRRWLAGETVPGWEGLWRAADLLDVPVWWWRCGGEDEQAMFGLYELRGSDETWPGHEYAWAFSLDAADRVPHPLRRFDAAQDG